ncbi:hypothetical protein JOF29_005345 [Kribbella aluminosa]|uniref:Uncharacterized protein n=1 Tax=Kribbella aluminosa TaxID=416017 RepID=A0ABS4URJ4_9ACTN|nr:hypothetical protein [Kribbella aluminosa]
MPEVFDDELTEDQLDELEARGAADDADVLLGSGKKDA